MKELIASARSDKGLLREANEDTVWAEVHYTDKKKPIGLFIISDGMGGHMGGKYASHWATEAIKRVFADIFFSDDPRKTLILKQDKQTDKKNNEKNMHKLSYSDLEKLVLFAINKANNVVYEFAQHKPDEASNAGTTISMLVVYDNQAIIANVGDSRTYILRDHRLQQVSQDHSLVARLVATGQILPDEVYSHPHRNVIFRYIGQKDLENVDIFHRQLQSGDYFLLCSDGLWEMIPSDEQIVQIIEKSKNPEQACKKLIEAANMAGGEDNIGVVVGLIK
jgi:PPM family protein phosphatase